MTDTTDTAALREQAEKAKACGGMFAISGEKALSLLEQLEAERQRADANEPVRCEGVPQHVHDMIDLQETIDELQAEVAELKGEQVPVANPVLSYADSYRAMARQGSDSVPIWGVITDLERNIAPLFTAPQKPVVLLPPAYEKSADFTEYHQGWNACRNYMLAEAKEVGGIVKDDSTDHIGDKNV